MSKQFHRFLAVALSFVSIGCVFLFSGQNTSSITDAASHLAMDLVHSRLWSDASGKTLSAAARFAAGQAPVLLSAESLLVKEEETASPSPVSAPPDKSPATKTDVLSTPTSLKQGLAFADNGVPSQTVQITNTAGYTVVDGVIIKNASSKTLDAAVLSSAFAASLQNAAPQILIIHTHGSEAYTLPQGQSYVSTGTYRTSDASCSVIRVGDEIAAVLSSYGLSVLHDRTLYDDPLYDGAYTRSLAGIESYLAKYPSITFVLDIHRDAVQDSAGRQYKLVSYEDSHAAQLSFVMGSNHDGWEENLKLAIAISAEISRDYPTVMRPVTLRNANYNQHKTSGSLLLEVGAAGNSLDEAVYSARIFAAAFARVLQRG